MDHFYDDVDFSGINYRGGNGGQAPNWNMGMRFSNPRDFYAHQEVRKNDYGGSTRGNFRGQYIFPSPPQVNFQRLNFYNYNHDDRNQNYGTHNHQNTSDYDTRAPPRNFLPISFPQQSLNAVFRNNYEIPTVNTKYKEKFVKKQVSSKEIAQEGPEAARKEALAAELRKSLRKFQKNHSKNSNNLLAIDKSKDTNKSDAATQPKPCFPWDLPLTVDDLKSIGRGKTGNIEPCADSCSENELSSLERQNFFQNPKVTAEPPAETSPDILFVKQCRKRKVSESIAVGCKMKKLDTLQPRRRHRSASPNLCEGPSAEDADGSSRDLYRDKVVPRESRDDSVLPPPPNVATSPRSAPKPSLMQLLGVRRREFSEMLDQPRNPRVQFMLDLLMKRHKELLLQRAIRSRYSTLGGRFGVDCEEEISAPSVVGVETQDLMGMPLGGMGASDTIDQLSKILLESSLTVDISNLPQELIDQLGNFLEMGVDLGSFSEVVSADGGVALNVGEVSDKLNQGEINFGDLRGVTSSIPENGRTTEENLSSQIKIKTENFEDEVSIEWEGIGNVIDKVSPNSSSCLVKEKTGCLFPMERFGNLENRVSPNSSSCLAKEKTGFLVPIERFGNLENRVCPNGSTRPAKDKTGRLVQVERYGNLENRVSPNSSSCLVKEEKKSPHRVKRFVTNLENRISPNRLSHPAKDKTGFPVSIERFGNLENRVSPNSSSCLVNEDQKSPLGVEKFGNPCSSERESINQSNETWCLVEDNKNSLMRGDNSNNKSEGSCETVEEVFHDYPTMASSLKSPREGETEENIFAKMWQIDQEIGKLMEEKQKLYDRLKKIRSDKSKDCTVIPISTDPQESSQRCPFSQSRREKPKMPKKNTTTNSSIRSTNPSKDLPSCSSKIGDHASGDVTKKSIPKSLDECNSAKIQEEVVLLNDVTDGIQIDAVVNTSCNSNSRSKTLHISNKSNDDPVEIVYDLRGISNAVEFTGHKDTILAIKLLGKCLYASCADYCIYCFSLKSYNVIRKFLGHTKTITSLQLHSANGAIGLYSGSHDKTLLKFNAKTGTCLKKINLDEPITCLEEAWGIIFIGTKEGTLERYSTKKSDLIRPAWTKLKSEVMAIQTSKEGPRRVLIIATRNKPIIVRDAYSGLLLRAINDIASSHIVFTIQVDHGLIYSGTSIYGLTAWDFTNGKCMKKYEKCGPIVSMKVVNGKIFAASYDGNIYIYDCEDSKPKHIIKATEKMLLCLAVRENKIYAGSLDKKLRFWTVP